MNEKRKAIIEEAMLLFATKGYHATSMQEIAEKVGISKGGIYLYFSSKNELLLEIYRYYYENLKKKMNESVNNHEWLPKERLQVQIAIYLEELLYQKEFILMHLNENVGYSAEVEEFLRSVKRDLVQWFQAHFIQIYGETIKPHTFDLTIMLKGMLESYLVTLLRTNILVPVDELAAYLISRTDDLVEGIMKKKEGPQLELSFDFINGQITIGEKLWRKQLSSCISQIENMLHL